MSVPEPIETTFKNFEELEPESGLEYLKTKYQQLWDYHEKWIVIHHGVVLQMNGEISEKGEQIIQLEKERKNCICKMDSPAEADDLEADELEDAIWDLSDLAVDSTLLNANLSSKDHQEYTQKSEENTDVIERVEPCKACSGLFKREVETKKFLMAENLMLTMKLKNTKVELCESEKVRIAVERELTALKTDTKKGKSINHGGECETRYKILYHQYEEVKGEFHITKAKLATVTDLCHTLERERKKYLLMSKTAENRIVAGITGVYDQANKLVENEDNVKGEEITNKQKHTKEDKIGNEEKEKLEEEEEQVTIKEKENEENTEKETEGWQIEIAKGPKVKKGKKAKQEVEMTQTAEKPIGKPKHRKAMTESGNLQQNKKKKEKKQISKEKKQMSKAETKREIKMKEMAKNKEKKRKERQLRASMRHATRVRKMTWERREGLEQYETNDLYTNMTNPENEIGARTEIQKQDRETELPKTEIDGQENIENVQAEIQVRDRILRENMDKMQLEMEHVVEVCIDKLEAEIMQIVTKNINNAKLKMEKIMNKTLEKTNLEAEKIQTDVIKHTKLEMTRMMEESLSKAKQEME